MEHVKLLHDSRDEFLAAAGGLTETQAKQSPGPGRWSVLDCVEHIAATEGRFLSWLETAATEGAPPLDRDKEAQLAVSMSSRARKAQSPEPARPVGKFPGLAEALAEFQAVRDRTIQFASTRAEGLYSLATAHPFFGVLNGAELVVLIASHTRRHRDQIHEVKAEVAP